jgi:hypothetical protein
MSDALEQVLRLVADGRLSAAQAAPLLDALGSVDDGGPAPRTDRETADMAESRGPRRPTAIRIEITQGGRRVVNLRVPVALGRMALERIPGLAGTDADVVRRAIADGRSGTLIEIDDEGDGVRIGLE